MSDIFWYIKYIYHTSISDLSTSDFYCQVLRKVIMKVFILLSVVVAALASQECGLNQHYSSCGTACPRTCDNYADPPRACILLCVPGCVCDPGYVKSKDGLCVFPEQCPENVTHKACGENEQFNECGTDCPLTCMNYRNPPTFCNDMCRIGCECKEGYVKSRDGRCVIPFNCPVDTQVCGVNEQFNECGTDCPLTCENYRNPPKFCNLMCRIGCGCKDGYVKSRDGRCVKPADCPVVKTCLGEPETGMCRGYFPMFHYDVQTGTCKQFIYGGCGGNGNRYATEEECMTHCEDLRPKQASSACDLPAESGVCRGFFPRYYFDKATGQCQRFIYGGCGGNENNFETEEECNKQCGARAVSLCELPAVTGPCKAYFPRYFFDQASGTCKQFVYGGCRGNENNFETLEECHNVCAARSVSLCELPAVTGPCRAYIPRYFFDQASGTCKQFIYGGCGGNENNFETLEQCHNVCA